MKLKYKFSLIFATVLTAILVVISLYFYVAIKDYADEQWERYIRTSVDTNTNIIGDWISDRFKVINSIQEIDFNDKPHTEKLLTQAFDTGYFEVIYVLKDDKYIENINDEPVDDDYVPSDEEWYQDCLAHEQMTILDPELDDTINRVVITLCRKLKDVDDIGIVGGDMTLDILQDVVEKMDSPLSHAIIIDRGTLIAHKNDKLLMKKATEVSPLFTEEYIKKYTQDPKNASIEEIKVKGISTLASFKPIKNSSWVLVFLINKDKAYQSINTTLITVLSITIIGLGLGILAVFLFVNWLLIPLLQTNEALANLAEGEGDLTLRLESKHHDEIGDLATRVNLFLDKLHSIISEVVITGGNLSEKASSFRYIAQESSQKVSEQQHQVNQIATAVHEMSATAHEVASNAESTAAATKDSNTKCEEGKTVIVNSQNSIHNLAEQISQASNRMAELNQNTNQITNILIAIQSISEQTNLLALNAAIEAARAGEHGRGFAVVADEVRGLSQKTKDSTEEIQSMIEALVTNTENVSEALSQSGIIATESVEEANKATSSLQDIMKSILTIADMSTHIASAAEEQRAVTEEVNKNVQGVNDISNDMVKSSGVVLSEADALKEIAHALNDQVTRFKI